MRRRTLSSWYVRLSLLALALLSPPLSSCMSPESVICASGLLCPPGQRCAAFQDVCIKTDCGDGQLQAGETCDDGNIQDNDGCSSSCASDERCGNRIIDLAAQEVCDDGNTLDGDGCSSDCRSSELCGNGRKDPSVGEACDDGNHRDGDGCSANCVSLEFCGNNIVDAAVGELCDDGNTTSGDGCSSDCRSGELCHDGQHDPGEACDDGNRNNEDNCVGECQIASCGDGYIDRMAPRAEACDTRGDSSTCDHDCTVPECGDGLLNTHAREKCDDGNEVDGDGCSADCHSTEACGNQIVDLRVGEVCDDGNHVNGDGCSSDCRSLEECGNGIRDMGEQCDSGGTDSELCDADCTLPVCGDGHQNGAAGEKCDDGNADMCGTCNAMCSLAQPKGQAEGVIYTIPGANLKDGESFTISDGIRRIVFEFDDGSGGYKPHTSIYFQSNFTDWGIAIQIRNEINKLFIDKNFDISAQAPTNSNTVFLKHERDGALNNQPVSESVANKDFEVVGMSGGMGYDCPDGMRCKTNEDCASGKCVGNVCKK